MNLTLEVKKKKKNYMYLRDCISRGLLIKYLTADEVIDYIREQHLYLNSDDK